jgi:type IV secretory pathway VirB2 component (pilin)
MMPKNIRGVIAFMLCMLFTLTASASTGAPGWLEESLYATGKFNTVTAVVGIIIAGLAIWMFTMDRKLKKLEEKIQRPGR